MGKKYNSVLTRFSYASFMRRMVEGLIPEDVKQFIIQHIDSIAHLEGLLMCRTNPQKAWSAAILARGLFIDESQTVLLLTRLSEQGFMVRSATGYHYQPKSPELASMVERLAELYKSYLLPITNLIHAKSKTRIQEFADAFRLRKD